MTNTMVDRLDAPTMPLVRATMPAAATLAARWSGRALTGVVVLALLADALVMLFAPALLRTQMAATGFPLDLAPLLGMILLIGVVLYAIPRTTMLGAILLTGFLGGAICTHLRVGEMGTPPQLICLALGIMTWGGLYLRDPRLRAMLPRRSTPL